MEAFPFSSFCGALFAVSMGIFLLFNSKQPNPYMDEIFHIPQAKKYCHFKFHEWDPKITTLPGLYLTSFAVLRVLAFISGEQLHVICSTTLLRLTNVIFFMGNVVLLKEVLFILHRGSSKNRFKEQETVWDKQSFHTKCSVTALILALFPVLYFFTFLYYTDTASVFFILLLTYLGLRGNHVLAAVAGTASIVMRQTNVVWVVFTAGVTTLKTIQPFVDTKLGEKPSSLTIELKEYFLSFFEHFAGVVKCLWSYGLVVVGFAAFVVVNGGIVVGDKAQHKATFNFPQLLYLIGFTLVFSSSHALFPQDILDLFRHLKKATSRPTTVIILMLVASVMGLLIYKFTYVHEYLLADNRHYPFYIWRKVYAKHWSIKYALIPIYMLAAWTIHHQLGAKQHTLWLIMFYICSALVTVPQKLLEFRYFIIPYMLYRLHMPLASYKRLTLECAFYVLVNAATVYLYLEKPFHWSHSPNDVQRFMW